ncbi:MAG: hypothetical protein UX68_C0035G0008 [Parcubacteria group bacterium GW2011_GWA2_46_9]|nr:MAG: hypothetical protein UX68_C0035G0008 [Parcubacteria group bacterium GW2011_GWA2_46_9]
MLTAYVLKPLYLITLSAMTGISLVKKLFTFFQVASKYIIGSGSLSVSAK